MITKPPDSRTSSFNSHREAKVASRITFGLLEKAILSSPTGHIFWSKNSQETLHSIKGDADCPKSLPFEPDWPKIITKMWNAYCLALPAFTKKCS